MSTPLVDNKEECPDVHTGVTYHKFWLLFFMNFFSVAYGTFMAAVFKTFGMDRIDDDNFLSIVGALTGIANGFSRFIWASWSDFSGFKFVYRVVLITQLICSGSLYYIADSKPLFLIVTCLSLACMGGHYALFPTVTVNLFGLHQGHKIYSFMFFSFGAASLMGIVYVKLLLKAVGYEVLLWIFFAMTVVSCVLTFFFDEHTDWKAFKEEKEAKQPQLD